MTRTSVPRSTCSGSQRGSGLILVLSILALLAVMATTFVTLMRLDTRATRNYVDDQRCEMLAVGMLNYVKSILRDDLDRTWGKYENRDTAMGYYAWAPTWSTPPDACITRVPGFYQYSSGAPVADEKLGIPVSNDFWFSPPFHDYTGDVSNLYEDTRGEIHQGSFSWRSHYGYEVGRIGRYWDYRSAREYDLWLGCNTNWWDSQGRMVTDQHPDRKVPIDDDMDGVVNPQAGGGTLSYYENRSVYQTYYEGVSSAIMNAPTYYQPGPRIVGEATLPGGLYWRWAFSIGPTQEMSGSLNAHGNVDGVDSVYLGNMGGVGLKANRAYDERTSLVPSEHLGRIEWLGFAGEYDYSTKGGFPRAFNNVMYPPAAANLEKLFMCHEFVGQSSSIYDRPPNLGLDRAKARALVRYRWGNGSGIPADGTDRWRVGWRRDGGSYYKFPSPESPMGSDRYFGANEMIEHDHSVDHPGTSAVAGILGDVDWRKLRPQLTMWATDTILRGKIWPTEGRLPWRPGGGTAGDWRHIDILKRVNPNIIGTSGPEALPGEDTTLKIRWAAKRTRERDRLYFMLVGALRFTNTPLPEHEACQFIASLADMVDRDQSETYYAAPDASGNWALGVEKHPVINEAAIYVTGANTPNYMMNRLRVELYNPMENVPWIPDASETYDISNYVLRIASHDYRLGDMVRYTTAVDTVHPDGMVIGAHGMYGDPADATADKKSWKRYAHVGWAVNWPPGLTRAELEGAAFSGVKLSLWKPLSSTASDGNPAGNVPLSPGKVELINGLTYVCVDATENLRLVHPYGPGTSFPTWTGPGGTQAVYLGIYRRWDPMNAKLYGSPEPPPPSTSDNRDQSNVLWCPGWSLGNFPTLGRPNTDYPGKASTTSPPGSGVSAYKYQRRFERNFKVMDGDLPSIGWLGELMMKNCAQDGPLTWVHSAAQQPTWNVYPEYYTSRNELDTKAKFDIQRPFATAGDPLNLHVLDMFTVWDPSSDGIDNDGDGAVDDDDTGYQAGDKGGPEVRVFGKLDVNLVTSVVMTMAFPDDETLRQHGGKVPNLSVITYYSHSQRSSACAGPFETVGDMIRSDGITTTPASLVSGYGLSIYSGIDDDGDGIFDERDERDLIFTWISNYYTTRSSVFEADLTVQLCEPPYYPGKWLPFKAYRTRAGYARKQLLGILDRSACLRVAPDGGCDFSGPIGTRLLRMTSDAIVY